MKLLTNVFSWLTERPGYRVNHLRARQESRILTNKKHPQFKDTESEDEKNGARPGRQARAENQWTNSILGE